MKKIILIIVLLNACLSFANARSDKNINTAALNTFQKQHIYGLNKRIEKIKDAQIKKQLYLEIEKTKNKQNCYCLNPQSSDFINCKETEDQLGNSSKDLNAKLAVFTAKCPTAHDIKPDFSNALESDLGLPAYYLGFPPEVVDRNRSPEPKKSETGGSDAEKVDSHTAPK